MKIIALCAVQPPSVAARGYSTPGAGSVLRVARLARLVGIVADVEVPAHRRVLAGEGVEGRHVVVIGQPRRVAGARIAAGLEQEDARMPASARRAASVPPPAPEPTMT